MKRLKTGGPCLASMAACSLTGLVFLSLPVQDNLARLSYDLPLLLRKSVPKELVMVYIDSSVKMNLNQPKDKPLDRSFHAQLVKRLTAEKASLVYFDVIFDEPGANPQTDLEFAQAIKENGRVILAGDFVRSVQASMIMEVPIPPVPVLREAAAAWGLVKITYDPDFGIRLIDPGTADLPSATWKAAELLLGAKAEDLGDRMKERWMNYYCSPNSIRAVNFDQALESGGLLPDFFKNKIVVIGSRPSPGIAGAARDEFATPYNRVTHGFSSGGAIHAIILVNLVRGDSLSRIPIALEALLLLAFGCALGAAVHWCKPIHLVYLLPGVGLATAFGAAWLQLAGRLWFTWIIPAVVQTGILFLWAMTYHYWVEFRKRQKLQHAFDKYLSPAMSERIVSTDYNLEPGGDACEVAVMFTDMANFTDLSEHLRSPRLLSLVLSSYFEEVSHHILQQNGTIIKYIGDAVLAVWGAPVPDPQKELNSVLAACEIMRISEKPIEGCTLETRIGIHTGTVVAGNLGCKFRFDYSVIGDNVNFASRLENLNKYFGTRILISDPVRKQMTAPAVLLRKLGAVIVKGKSEAMSVYEVIGRADLHAGDASWVKEFESGMHFLEENNHQAAGPCFERTIQLRGKPDKPSSFYLDLINRPGENSEAALLDNGVVKFLAK